MYINYLFFQNFFGIETTVRTESSGSILYGCCIDNDTKAPYTLVGIGDAIAWYISRDSYLEYIKVSNIV